MRKTLIALGFAATLPALALAAVPAPGPLGGPLPMGHGPMMMDRPHAGDMGPFRHLDLDPEQRHQVGRLMGDEMRQRHAITDSFLKKLPAADQAAYQEQLKANQDKTRSDIRALLKPDQQKRFDEAQQQADQRRAEWAEFLAWKAQKDHKAQ